MKITTWEELQAMTPEQRRAHFEQSIVWDPEHHPDPAVRRLYDEACRWARQRVAEEEGA